MTVGPRSCLSVLLILALSACAADPAATGSDPVGTEDAAGVADAALSGSGEAPSSGEDDTPSESYGSLLIPSCGNGTCQGDKFEDCLTCPEDCGPCVRVCPPLGGCSWNPRCNSNPNFNSCGNGVCQPHACEFAHNCPRDCAPQCGDGYCTHAETCETCPGDCGECRTCDSGGLRCGDGVCSPECGEHWLTCTDCPILQAQ